MFCLAMMLLPCQQAPCKCQSKNTQQLIHTIQLCHMRRFKLFIALDVTSKKAIDFGDSWTLFEPCFGRLQQYPDMYSGNTLTLHCRATCAR